MNPAIDNSAWSLCEDVRNFDAQCNRVDPTSAGLAQPAAEFVQRDLSIDLTTVEQVLRKTRHVALGKYRCPEEHPQFLRGGGPHTCAYITFPRTSVRLRIGDGIDEVSTPNNVGFHNVGESYSRETIGAGGDDCDWIAVTPEFVAAIYATLGVDPPAGKGKLFPRAFSPLSPRAFYAQRRLFTRVTSPREPMSSTQIERGVADLLTIILKDALSFWRGRGRLRSRQRIATRRRSNIVERAKTVLAREYWTHLLLSDLAQDLYCSAAHLSRIFLANTGFNLSDYRQELRLRRGLSLLEESQLEIGKIALHLGFASHSHFTSAFHRRFGVNPSAFVEWKTTQSAPASIMATDAVARFNTYLKEKT